MAKFPSKPTTRGKALRFAEQERAVLPGSEKTAAVGAVHVKSTSARSKVTVSVILKRKEPLKINRRGGRANGPVRVTRTEFKRHHAAESDSLRLVKAFARGVWGNAGAEDDRRRGVSCARGRNTPS